MPRLPAYFWHNLIGVVVFWGIGALFGLAVFLAFVHLGIAWGLVATLIAACVAAAFLTACPVIDIALSIAVCLIIGAVAGIVVRCLGGP